MSSSYPRNALVNLVLLKVNTVAPSIHPLQSMGGDSTILHEVEKHAVDAIVFSIFLPMYNNRFYLMKIKNLIIISTLL